MNPCPGGCDSIAACDCSPTQLQRYRHKLSAPLLDRIDIQIELGRLEQRQLLSASRQRGETSAAVRKRVQAARICQLQRQGCLNAHLDNRGLSEVCRLDDGAEAYLLKAIEKLGLSARSYHKLLKVTRSIADLANCQDIGRDHLAEAIACRRQQVQRP